MARYKFWQYIVSDTGEPLENVNVRIYLTDSPTYEADIFTHPTTGESTFSSTASLTTDGNGYFECWFGDGLEGSGGYSADQRFNIEWERAGLSNGLIEGISPYPNTYQVNENDNSTPDKDVKNKMISNQLAYNWELHRNIGSTAHNLSLVDYTDTNTDYNKLVSNSLMNYMYSVMTSAGAASISASAAVAREFDITSWTSSGNSYYTEIDHFLGKTYPIVSVYKTSNSRKIEPDEIESVSSSKIRIWMPEEVNLDVTVIG